MTPEEHQRLDQITTREFSQALKDSTRFIYFEGDELKTALYPLWEQAVHRILLAVAACPCSDDNAECFLNWGQEEQGHQFGTDHPLSFSRFLRIFQKTRALAFLVLSHGTQDTGIQ